MSGALKLLASTRDARREVAMIKLAAARHDFDLAYAACQQALAEVGQAKHWRADLLSRCALGAQQSLREALLPACDALLQQRQQQFSQRQNELSAAYECMSEQRQALMHCERDVLRLDEWQGLHHAETQRYKARQEDRLEEELARQRRPGGRGA